MEPDDKEYFKGFSWLDKFYWSKPDLKEEYFFWDEFFKNLMAEVYE